jgi:asparaginyl-tRNA synthetase
MIEPEICFCDLADIMDCAENYVKFCLNYVLDNNKSDIEFLGERLKRENDTKKDDKTPRYQIDNLESYLKNLISQPFGRCSYTDAIKLLEKAIKEGHEFENPVHWGIDMATEHERYLAEVIFKRPVCVYNYPREFKAFYMRRNEDGKTVGAMDLLAPGVGELIGGSEREER